MKPRVRVAMRAHGPGRASAAKGHAAFVRIALLAALLCPHPGQATIVSFLGMEYRPGRPLPNDTLDAAIVMDSVWLKQAVDQNLELMRRLVPVKFQVIGSTDGRECRAASCEALARRRAALFQAALVQGGAPTTRFCAPKAVITPWPSDYAPTESDRTVARTAYLDPIFGECP